MSTTLRLLGLLLAGATLRPPLAAQAKTNLPQGKRPMPTTLAAAPKAGRAAAFQPLTYHVMGGYVFEDANYGGGIGHAPGASGTVGRQGVRVEFYFSTGGYAGAATTDANGYYSVQAYSNNYIVRVVNNTVTSSRPGYSSALVPVQTYNNYNNNTNVVGGTAPEKVDAGANNNSASLGSLNTNTTIAQSQAVVNLGTTDITNINFGFNFDVVVNTNDAGQGSLRQFILNANALGNETDLAQDGYYTNAQDLAANSTAAGRAGVALPVDFESSIFMIPTGRLTNGKVAVITPTSALPQLTGPCMSVNGLTQTYNMGNTNDVLLGVGGTVGTQAAALSQLNGPEVQLVGNTSIAFGLDVAASATNARLGGLAIYGFGNAPDRDAAANIRSATNGVIIALNVLGSPATSFTAPAALTNADNVRLVGGTNGFIYSNLIGFANGKGITTVAGVTNALVKNNEIRTNGQSWSGNDGVDINGSNSTVQYNLLTGTSSLGFDSFLSTGGNTVTGNTVTDNGRGAASLPPDETGGIRVYGANNRVAQNIVANNYGAGVLLVGTGTNRAAASTTVISQNAIYGNGTVTARNGAAATGQIGIDLQVNGDNEAGGTLPFVTLNSATTTGANALLNYPVLRTASILGTNLVLTGYAKPGAVIELFLAQANPASPNATGANFGQGKTYLTTLTEGINDADASTNQSYGPGNVNGFAQGSDTNANGFSFTIPLSSLPGGTLAAGTLLTSTATLNGATSEFSGNVVATAALTGYVYEDVNYGGGAGRSRATLGSAANGRPGATVELYNASGTLVATTTTDSNGQYAFGITAASGYTVRVVNSTVSSSRPGYTSGLLPVPTYSGNVSRVGGENPALGDAAANTGSQSLGALSTSSNVPQSIATASVGTGAANNGPDFGFNFDVVVNTNDAGQGSLRQFILNSNALGGESDLAQDGYYTDARNLTGSTAAGLAGVALPVDVESSIFMIPVSGVAVITPASALPQITGANTAVNGATQTYNIGNSNNALLGNGGTVGTQATPLSQLNGPEVQLVGSTAIGIGLKLAGAGDQVRGLAIYGFGNFFDDNNNSNITVAASNVLIADNVLGSTATSFAVPPVANNNSNVRVASGTGVSFTNNLIGFANGSGIYLAPAVTTTTITGNEIRGNARTGYIYDGIDSHGSGTKATGNLFADGGAQGFDSATSTGGHTVTGNTFINNGIGNTTGIEESAAARFYGTGNTFSQNISTGNYGAGVEVAGGTTAISRNSIYNNGTSTSAKGASATGQIGIDLIVKGQNDDFGTSPFVTLNSATTTGANNLQNYPVLRTASLVGTNLVLTGYAKPGAVIELFLAQANPSTPNAIGANFGQGKTYLTTLTEGINDADANTNQSYSGNINGFNQGSDNSANGFSFTIPLSSLPGGTLAAGTLLTSTATLNGATSEFSGNVATVAIAPLMGYVYEDVNYGGGAGRSFATLATPSLGRAGAKVELYNSNEDLVGTAITDANGQYAFIANPGTGYTVRVVNNSVLSSRLGATAASGSASTGYVSNQLGVQTYNGTTDRVGGENPALADAPANAGSQSLSALRSATAVPQSIATASVGTGITNAGPDFGFNFDVVVNTNNAGLGSLRQFILNSNALGNSAALAQVGSNAAGALPAGKETTIFMIPSGAAVPGQRAGLTSGLTSGVATIAPVTALPGITGVNTVVDGTTQTFNIGNTNDVALGVGGTVGTAATALSKLNGPEVQLIGTRSFEGLSVQANSVTVRGVALYGFTNNIGVGLDYTGTLIEQNVIGTAATRFADPGANVRTTQQGVYLYNSDNGTVRNNLIGYNGGMGVWVYGDQNGANNNTVYNNEIRGNALEVLANGQGRVFEGLELQGTSTGNTVSGNLITESMGNGIDTYANTTGGNTVTGNTISNNGQGIVTNTGNEGSGLRIYSGTKPTTISNNILSGNNASGVLLVNSAAKVLISQNSIFGNVRIGIDLLTTAEANANIANTYSGNTGTTTNVTRNSATTAGANGLLNYPVFTSATLSGSSLVVKGYAKGSALIEFFVAQPTASSAASPNNLFGQGATYLFTATEGTSADADTRTGLSYGPSTNGIEQGSDTNANGFSFVIQLTREQQAAVTAGTLLTSTATLGGVTSEFSGNIRVTSAPLPVVLTTFTAQAVQGRDALLDWATASETNNDHFEVERSFDGTSFTQIGTVAGHGTTAVASAYSLTDAGVAAKATGPVYYRLRQVDFGGAATYSPVRVVRFAPTAAVVLNLYPIPAQDHVQLDLSQLPAANTYQVQVLDATGRAVSVATLGGGLPWPLEIQRLATGTYHVLVKGQLADGSSFKQTLRLTKE